MGNAREDGYRERDDFEELRFKWSGMPYDPERSTEACQWISDQIP
ncbi:hypothetical protein HALLA_12050 [Halostagnicola larsenii XH-48]|uniref:Uncharacterized protein n=1 Tax=Halostagnicola larsenii XH-48 TaxID=797299 RepID=W0JUF9_9EURY|nr:hypothetical protein HALLA_12050 [Halostagnicola larsenii XH-48]